MAFTSFASTDISHSSAINNNTAKQFDLTLTQFAGEILASYQRAVVLSDKVKKRTISRGKSAQFPLTGRAKAHYHTTGSHVLMDGIKSAQRLITIPGVVTAATFIDDFENAVMHYDVRQEYAIQLGRALADLREIHTAIVLHQTSHATKVIDDDDQVDGKWIEDDRLKIDAGSGSTDVKAMAAAIVEDVFLASKMMDEANVDDMDRMCALRPNEYNALFEGIAGLSGYAFNRDFGGSGSFATGQLPPINNVKFLKAPAIPSKNIAQDSDNYKFYHNDCSKLIGFVFKPEAMGCLELMSVSVEHERKMEYLGELVLAKHAYGMGALRPECCVALELDTLTNA